jgi:hypothetical protein
MNDEDLNDYVPLGALLAVSAKEQQIRFAIVALLPTVVFWALDAFYLHQERLFRALYDRVRLASDADLDRDPYSLSTQGLGQHGPLAAAFRPVLLFLHGVILVSIGMVIGIVVASRR